MLAVYRKVKRVVAALTYANVMSTLAVFLVLGGAAYAATTLPTGSVGTRQLRDGAVTGDKLGSRAVDTDEIMPGAVTIGRLSDRVRALVTTRPEQGPAGQQGPAGARGSAGPGASLVRYSAPATADADPALALDMPGLQLRAACTENGGDVGVTIAITPGEAVTGYDRFTADQGTVVNSPTFSTTGNLGLDLPGGVETVLGGPSTNGGSGYARAIATLIVAGPARTITLDVAVVADADTHRCSLDGTAVPADA